MLHMSCFHEKNTSISSSTCAANNVEESQHLLEQDMDRICASINSASLSIPHVRLMAKASEVSSTLDPDASHNDDNDEENDNFASTHEKGKIVLQALSKNKIASSKFFEIMGTLVEHEETIEALEASLDKCYSLEHAYAYEIADTS